jgi:predicted RNase H-like HicB family nuclease
MCLVVYIMSTVILHTDQKISEISFKPPELSSNTLKESYRIVLEKDEDGRIVVRSPDLQGVVTDGADENDAIRNAFEAVDSILEARGLTKQYNLILIHKLRA